MTTNVTHWTPEEIESHFDYFDACSGSDIMEFIDGYMNGSASSEDADKIQEMYVAAKASDHPGAADFAWRYETY